MEEEIFWKRVFQQSNSFPEVVEIEQVDAWTIIVDEAFGDQSVLEDLFRAQVRVHRHSEVPENNEK